MVRIGFASRPEDILTLLSMAGALAPATLFALCKLKEIEREEREREREPYRDKGIVLVEAGSYPAFLSSIKSCLMRSRTEALQASPLDPAPPPTICTCFAYLTKLMSYPLHCAEPT